MHNFVSMNRIETIVVFSCVLLLSYAATLPADKLKHYHGYQVIRASPETPNHFQVIYELIAQDKYDFWRTPSRSGHADVMLSPAEYDQVTSVLKENGVPFYTMIPNVEILLEQERQRKLSDSKRDMDWEEYHNWDEVNTWLSNLVAGSVNGSNIQISSEKYGTSLEGRDLLVYKVSSGGAGSGNSTKSAIWIDATIHAREHITTAVITYIINELVTNSRTYADILEHVDFYFVPFVNPDGFVYSHEVDRLWRKTRSNWLNTTCIGVDPNRNFGFHWGEPDGASNNPCSSGYHGPEPYSEPETKAIRDYILDKAETQNVSWVTYVTLHSYGQLWLSPWGYTITPPEDHSDVLQVSKDAVDELKKYFNTSYTIGNSAAALYFTSGTSQDWAKGEGGFKFVYTVELRDTGRHGFLLPPEQIVDTSMETWAGLQVVAREMLQRRVSMQK